MADDLAVTLFLTSFPSADTPLQQKARQLLGSGKATVAVNTRRYLARHYRLLELFAMPAAQDEIPVAAIERAGELGAVDDDWWIRVDPVVILPNLTELCLVQWGELGIGAAESLEFGAELSSLLEPGALNPSNTEPLHWRLRMSEAVAVATTPPERILGRTINAWLPVGEAAKTWHRLMNEIQMQLHQAEVNERRARQGLSSITSVWFWGAGKAPAPTPCPWNLVYSNDPFIRGLAVIGNAKHQTSPQSARAWLEHLEPHAGNILLAPEARATEPLSEDSLPAWRETWLEPLRKALGKGQIDRLRVVLVEGDTIVNQEFRPGIWSKFRLLQPHG